MSECNERYRVFHNRIQIQICIDLARAPSDDLCCPGRVRETRRIHVVCQFEFRLFQYPT